MPVQLTYPGVYVEEVASGVRTITGVATSVTAFVGRAARGPVDTAVTLTSYADFERVFGGLWSESALGFAVRDFYLNGGATAVIVRLHRAGAAADTAELTVGTGASALTLRAAAPGAWGAKLTMSIDKLTRDPADPLLINLTVTDTGTGSSESLRNVSIAPTSPRRLDLVLANESALVRVKAPLPAAPLPAASATASAGAASDGDALNAAAFTGVGFRAAKRGLYALEQADLVNLLVIPPYLANGDIDDSVRTDAIAYCRERRAIAVLDPPSAWATKDAAKAGVAALGATKDAALYFPRLRQPNPLRDGQIETFAPSGAVAGVIARTDATRGVWKAPAGLEATLAGVPELAVALTDGEIGELNPLGVNTLRSAPAAGRVVWGARTREGDDRLASEWKYLPVRRTALYIEESLYRGTQWVVFEPNDEPLWSQIRLNVGAFMNTLFRQGAFQGTTPREAYLVKCDRETTTQDDVNRGVVNIVVGFAPLKPAEFVVLRLTQLAGQIAT